MALKNFARYKDYVTLFDPEMVAVVCELMGQAGKTERDRLTLGIAGGDKAGSIRRRAHDQNEVRSDKQ
jgi:hypothetical protein